MTDKGAEVVIEDVVLPSRTRSTIDSSGASYVSTEVVLRDDIDGRQQRAHLLAEEEEEHPAKKVRKAAARIEGKSPQKNKQ